MAIKNSNTINTMIDPDLLEEALTRIQYAHGLTGLLTEQRDFSKLPAHQQHAIHAISCFTFEAESAIRALFNQDY
jgi:hypothetical protein